MKKLFLITFLLSSFCATAQYHKAKLLMTDGSTKEGLARLPSNKILDNKIEFKTSQKGTVVKLEEDNVSQILYTSKKGTQFLFERSNVIHLFKSFGKAFEKEKANKHWILLYHNNDAVSCYSLAQRYKLDKKGRMSSITGGNSFWYTVYFLMKRPTEEKVYIVNGKGFTHGQVRKAYAIYFKDHPKFVKRIMKKEFKGANVSDVADAFADSL